MVVEPQSLARVYAIERSSTQLDRNLTKRKGTRVDETILTVLANSKVVKVE